jgi:hypothetical protein
LKKKWLFVLSLLSPTTTGKQQADNQQQPTTNNDHYSADHQPVHHQRGHWEGLHSRRAW